MAKMYRVPPTGPWWPAVGPRLERGVRRRSRCGSALTTLEHLGCLLLMVEDAAGCEPLTLLMVIVFEPPRDRREGATTAHSAAVQQTGLLNVFCLARHQDHRLQAATDGTAQFASHPRRCHRERADRLCIPSADKLATDAAFDDRTAAVTRGRGLQRPTLTLRGLTWLPVRRLTF